MNPRCADLFVQTVLGEYPSDEDTSSANSIDAHVKDSISLSTHADADGGEGRHLEGILEINTSLYDYDGTGRRP